MKTIGNSIELLQVIAARIKGAGRSVQLAEHKFYSGQEKLRAQSHSFDAYMRKSGVLETLTNPREDWSLNSKALWDVCTYMPFAYA